MKKRRKISRKKRRLLRIRRLEAAGFLALCVLTAVLAGKSCARRKIKYDPFAVDAAEPDIDVRLLSPNKYSRPGDKLDRVKGVVIHYTANPGSSAKNNRDYFESLKDGHERSVSSHFVIGLKGEIIQCVPLDEIAYASNNRNADTISIECCHPDKSGKFKAKTYRSAVRLSAWLCMKFGLTEKDVIRHYDVNGKICPKYFVDNEDAWEEFRNNVKTEIGRLEKKAEKQSQKAEEDKIE